MVNPITDKLKKNLMKVIQESNNREQHVYDLLVNLGYEKIDSLSKLHMDAFLLKLVDDCLGKDDIHNDMMLMAFGLLKGFEYKDSPSDTDRRILFLLKTDYLMINKRSKSKDFSSASIDVQKCLVDSLRRTEPRWVNKLAVHLRNQKGIEKYVDEIDDYVNKKQGTIISVKLPDPRYPKRQGIKYDVKLILKEVLAIKNNTRLIGLKLSVAGIMSIMVVFLSVTLVSDFMPKAQVSDHIYLEKTQLSPMKDADGIVSESRRKSVNSFRVVLTNKDEVVNQSLDEYWSLYD